MQTNRSNAGALVGGAVLIALGLLSLAGQIFRDVNWGGLWPLLVIGMGMLFFVAMLAGGKQAAGFAVPGSIVGGIGLVLLFQSLTGHWQSMSYFWTLIILFVGTGVYIMGQYTNDESQKKSGLRVMKVGLVLFLLFGAFFEILFSSYNGLVFPLLLILLGVYLVVVRSGLLAGKPNKSIDSTPPVS